MNRLYFVILLFVSGSCTTNLPDPQILIDEIYNAKVYELQSRKLEDCKTKQLDKAGEKVDSIVHKLLNADLLDTVDFPARPIKPPTPKHIIGTVDKFEIKK